VRSDNLSLAYQLLELKPFLENSFVNKVSELKKGFIKIKLHTKEGSKDLILAPNSLFISQYSLQARHGKSNFAHSLKEQLYNKKITGIEQHEFDRVVTIKLLEHSLVLELLGEGNKILLGNTGKIISSEKNEEWSDRTIKKSETYSYPKPKGISPLEISAKELEKIFSESEKNAIKTLVNAVNAPPLACEEIFFRAKINKDKKAKEISKKELEKILALLKELCTVTEKNLKPVFYSDFAYPFELEHLSGAKKIPSLNAFIDETISSLLSKNETEKETEQKDDSISRLEFHAKQQNEAGKKFEKQIEENNQKAELLYKHFSELEELRTVIRDAVKKGYKEKEIMYKISSAAQKGNKAAKLLTSVDLAEKRFSAELD